MTDERNIAHDRKVAGDRHPAEDIARAPRAGHEPSQRIAHELAADGDAPTDRSHDTRDNAQHGAMPHGDGTR